MFQIVFFFAILRALNRVFFCYPSCTKLCSKSCTKSCSKSCFFVRSFVHQIVFFFAILRAPNCGVFCGHCYCGKGIHNIYDPRIWLSTARDRQDSCKLLHISCRPQNITQHSDLLENHGYATISSAQPRGGYGVA